MADLPPSSRKTRFEGGRALLHDALADGRRSGERDQVDLRRKGQLLADEVVGRRHDVEDAGGDLRLIGDEAAEAGGVPWRVGRGLEDHGVAGGEGLPELVQRHLDGEIPRDDGTDDAHRLLPDLTRVLRPAAIGDRRQVGPPCELVDQPQRVAESALQRDVQLVGVGGHPGAADLEDELLAQRLPLALERPLQLGQAFLAPVAVGGPVRLVEGSPRGVDGPVHLVDGRVGHLADHLLGRRVDVVERPARVGLDELAVHQHPCFVVCRCRHRPPVSLRGSRVSEIGLSKSVTSIIERPAPPLRAAGRAGACGFAAPRLRVRP